MPNHKKINFLGRVIDQEKHAPISGAKVILNFPGSPPVVYTDLEGIYRFTVNADNHNISQGQITVEADGYNTSNSIIQLSQKSKDLGDIKLVIPSAKSNNNITYSSKKSDNSTSDMLMPIMTALMIALATIMIAVLIQPSTRSTPQEILEPSNNYRSYIPAQ
ncbi:carboxypeptidase-like regulatory domain-containing protein [Iningainema tapete]|uniref:Uncharacterized protein n=1 Tax=Iningainema tapete BLCC-T55 TaxID=2748662 RepID=A0A8J7C400_9CYAN|nr:carboxypeptidase-like regulatory domain-containing protein [Iningainema tapete]MBD2770729.1 hypothetical protein [Iningainema tapete BLCC-T55]